MRADPMNIVFRHGKPRMTIDKKMQKNMLVFVVGIEQRILFFLGKLDLVPFALEVRQTEGL
jgi:hypothetical protein